MNEINLLVEQEAGRISFNYDETKAFLEEKMAEYEGAVFTDETMDIAKRERAFLRKLKDQMDGERKKVKRAWEEPYKAFELQVKELLALVDKPVELIDGQVKEYEERKRSEKLEHCREVYEEEAASLSNFLAFDRIFDEKWLNVSVSIKSIRDDIRQRVQTIKTQLDTIEMMDSEAVEEAVKIYKDTLDITKAVAHINNYEAQKKAIVEREAARREAEERERMEAERERIRAEERERIRKEEELAHAVRQEVVGELKEVSQQTREKSVIFPDSVAVLYLITATEEELAELETTMTSLGICYERKE